MVVDQAASPEPVPSVRAIRARNTTTSATTAAKARDKRPVKRARRMTDAGTTNLRQFQNAVLKRRYQRR
jgi:hypothetical protein